MTINEAHEIQRDERAGEQALIAGLWLSCVVCAQTDARETAEHAFAEIMTAAS